MAGWQLIKWFNLLIMVIVSLVVVACGPTFPPEAVQVELQPLPTATPLPRASPVITEAVREGESSAESTSTGVQSERSKTASIVIPTEALTATVSTLPTVTPVLAGEAVDTVASSEEVTLLPGREVLVAKAKEMLTQLPGINVPTDDISLVAIEARQWRDSSLGCPRESMMYNPVITPGYLLVLQAGDKQYEFHTNTTDNVVLCLIDGEDALEALQP